MWVFCNLWTFASNWNETAEHLPNYAKKNIFAWYSDITKKSHMAYIASLCRFTFSWTGRRSNRHYLCKFLAKMILVILLWHLYVHLFHGHNKWVRKPSCETIQGYISVKYHLTSTLNTNKHLTVSITNSKIRLYLQKLFKISFESSSGSIISLAQIWERSSDRIYGARDDIG